MASILNLIAQPMAPNISGAFEQGRAQARQVERERLADQELRAQIERQNQLRQLAGQAYSAQSPAERERYVSQAASVDPQAAAQIGQDLGSDEERRKQRLGLMAMALTKLPEPQRPMLYQQMLPELRQLGLNAPDQYSPELDELAQSLAAVVSGSAAPANLRYFQAMTQGLPAKDVERARRIELGLEGRASSAGMSMQKITGPDGREYAVVFDPRTGAPRPVSMEELFGAQPQAVQPTTAPPQGPAVAPPVMAPSTPFAGLTPAEKAEQEARARAQVELATKPQIERETQRARGAEKRHATYIDEGLAAADALPVINRAIELLDSVRTGGIDAVKLAATNFFGVTGADEGELSNNLGKAVLSQLRSTFGAQFTEREGARLAEIEAGFGKSTAVNRRLLAQTKAIVERAARRGIASAREVGDEFAVQEIERSLNMRLTTPGEPVPISSPQERDALPPGTQYIAPDGSVRTKR